MNLRYRTSIVAAALTLLSCAPSALAQCSMCRTGAQATGDGGATLNFAILVLIFPVLSLFAGILIPALLRRDRELEEPAKPRPQTKTVLNVKWLEEPR